ncbi:ABC transporter ATP-binding protein [Janibacter sp. YIM B02568]|uniref:ABC transporter ATP-binding protein n=1 Tax=Janibacter endophyticus TaxID=2806261 RepID=UPI00194FB7B2|nr:ABC transporter ATP-binding protein [Janibacter endophyticus]MBM6545357.1 ABC transporter ATP-binding protein [Janibacter endophyticus]
MLKLDGVTVLYGEGAPALHQLDLTVRGGSITAVVGGNGAGKTTLMRAVSGVLPFRRGRISEGSVSLEGDDLRGLSADAIVRRGIAHVPEGRRVFTELTVDENLSAGSAATKGRADDVRAEVYELFPVLADRRSQRAILLSGGEQQMLAIGRGLMSRPRLLLLDEPTLGLAPKIVEQIGEIVQVIRERGTTVMLVEQNAAMALSVADDGYVLEQGAVVLSGPTSELRATDQVKELYLGGSGGDEDRRLELDRAAIGRWSA